MKNVKIFILFCYLFINISIYQPDSFIYKTTILEDFEAKSIINFELVTKLSKEFEPELLISNVFTYPFFDSKTSLLLKIPQTSNQSFKVLFKDKKKIYDYIQKFDFYIFATQGGGSLFFLIKDEYNSSFSKILISHLDFQGWKKISIDVRAKLNQDNLIFSKNSFSEFSGLVYEAPMEMTRGREDIIVIDDILIEVRDKRKLPELEPLW